MLLLAVVLSQTLNPYAGLGWKGPLPGIDAQAATRIGARIKDPSAKGAALKAAFSATDFQTAGPRTAAATVVGAAKSVTRQQAAALVDGLNEAIDSFERESRKNNVAHALAFLIASALQGVTNHLVPDEKVQALAQAINDELAASPGFKTAPAKDRQQLYETSIVVGALIGGMNLEAGSTHNADLALQARRLAEQVLGLFGVK